MRDSLLFILILSLFVGLVALPSAAQNKQALRIGHEPKLALPKPELPDMTYYYGQTGEELQALNFRSLEILEDALLRPLAQEPDEYPFKRFRKYLFKNFAAGLPRAQMMLLVRDQLPAIIESYTKAHSKTTPSEFFQNEIAKNLALGDRSDYSDYRIKFEYDSEGRFQVGTIEPNRLGINTGYEIIFNLRDITKKEKFTVAEAVQLWLHELMHLDKNTPLEVKDAWGAKVAQWVSERTTEIQLSSGRKVVALSTPDADTERLEFLNGKPEDHLRDSVQSRFLIFEESKTGTRKLQNIYSGFSTFANSLIPLDSDYRPQSLHLPLVNVQHLRMVAPNSLQIEYTQGVQRYDRSYNGVYEKSKGVTQGSPLMGTPGDRFRVEWNFAENSLETSRAYSRPLAEGDFEIYRVKDIGEKRFVSIRVKTQNLEKLMKADSLHLLAKGKGEGKSSSSSELLSYEIKMGRVLSKGEVLMQVVLPQKTLEISQILIPSANSESAYSEIALRPSRPAILQGAELPPSSKQPIVQAVSVIERSREADVLKIKIDLSETKDISGLTIDLEHQMLEQKFRFVNFGWQADQLGTIGLGRKYFISTAELQKSSQGVLAIIPEINMTKYELGPVMKRPVSRFYTEQWQDKLPYLQDTRARKVARVWVHFKDGRVEKVAMDKMPKELFSYVSQEARDKELQRYKSRLDYILGDSADDKAVSPAMTCEDLF